VLVWSVTTLSEGVMRSGSVLDASASAHTDRTTASVHGNDVAAKANLPAMKSEDALISSPPKVKRSRDDLASLDASDVQHSRNINRSAMFTTESVRVSDVAAKANLPSMKTEDALKSPPTKSKRSRDDHASLDTSDVQQSRSFKPAHPAAASFHQIKTEAPAGAPKRRKKILEAYPMHQNASDTSRKIIQQLKSLYRDQVRPIEQNLYNFCLPTNAEIHESEFDANPMVLLLGQYSTGKTTFIRHLVGGDFPSMHIGPEPTTDRFTALIHGEEEGSGGPGDGHARGEDSDSDDEAQEGVSRDRWQKDGVNRSLGKTVKGNSLTVMPELPFSSLATFGAGFLSHFVGSVTPAPLLEHVTLIDTPGVLSGEKQRLSRSYDFAKASRWFADRSDLILILFDAHKLDISDELKDVIETIRPHNDDKVRCVLNKADGVTREQLVRVYGSLMWSMGKIFDSPEVVRVFTGSYWDEPLQHDDFAGMFESDEWLLIHELVNLPKSCAERKVNEIVKRIRIIKVHVCILNYLKSQMPRWFGKRRIQEGLIENLEAIFETVRIEHGLSSGDFPEVQEFAACLEKVDDFSTFVHTDRKTLHQLDDLLLTTIPNIMKGLTGITDPLTPKTKAKQTKKKTLTRKKRTVKPSGKLPSPSGGSDDFVWNQEKTQARSLFVSLPII